MDLGFIMKIAGKGRTFKIRRTYVRNTRSSNGDLREVVRRKKEEVIRKK